MRCAPVLAVALLAPAGPAAAQIVERYFPTDLPGYESDVTLPMANYDPRVAHGQGFRIDGLTLDTSASEAVGYDSAPLGSFGGSSPTLVTGANVSLRSDWARDALGAQIGVSDHRYFDVPIANYTNWDATIGGALDVGPGRVDVGYDHINQNLAPTELGTLAVTAPVPYSDDDERLNVTIPFAQIAWTPAFEHQQFSFADLTRPIPLDYANNDHDITTGSLTADYPFSKGRSLVALVRGSSAEYVPNGTGVRNDYTDILGFAGVNLQATAVVEVRALVGAENRSFPFMRPLSRTIPTAEVDLIWQLTRLTDVLVWFSREFEDPTFPFASTEVLTLGRIELEHSLRRDVELRAFASVGSSAYAGAGTVAAGAQLDQKLTTLGGEAEWDVNRHLAMTLDYNHQINDFEGQVGAFTTPFNAIRSYSEDVVTLGVTLRR